MPLRSCPTPSIGPRGRVEVTPSPKSFLRAAGAAKKQPAQLKDDRSFLSSAWNWRRCSRVNGFTLNGGINRAIVIPAVGRSRTSIPIIDQQGRTQLLCFHGKAGRLLRCSVGHNAMAQIASKNGIVIWNRFELPAELCVGWYP